MHQVVKILTDDDGEKVISPKWHLVTKYGDAPRTFCGGEVFGEGESIAKFQTKMVAKGGITCRLCLEYIAKIKSVQL